MLSSSVDVGDKEKSKENDGDNDLDREDPDYKPEKSKKDKKAADDSSDEEGGADDDDDATAIKFKSKHVDDQEYDEPEDDEQMDDKDGEFYNRQSVVRLWSDLNKKKKPKSFQMMMTMKTW